jgi:hypothetical protein
MLYQKLNQEHLHILVSASFDWTDVLGERNAEMNERHTRENYSRQVSGLDKSLEQVSVNYPGIGYIRNRANKPRGYDLVSPHVYFAGVQISFHMPSNK